MKCNLNDYQVGSAWGNFCVFGGDEYELVVGYWRRLKALQGKTPCVVAKEMLEEFFRCFPEALKEFQESFCLVASMQAPKGYHNTWKRLDRNLQVMAQVVARHYEQVEFLERMRFLVQDFRGDIRQAERRKNYRRQERKKEPEKEAPIHSMGHCRLCWRAVPRRRGVASNLFCARHKYLPPQGQNPEYRRRARMLKSALRPAGCMNMLYSDRVQNLLSHFAPYRRLQGEDFSWWDHEPGGAVLGTWDEVWYSCPEIIIQQLPYVSNYLSGMSVALDSSASIVQALESPLDSGEMSADGALWADFHREAGLYFDAYYEHLVLAEVWLELEAKTVHGGKRARAGRKMKA